MEHRTSSTDYNFTTQTGEETSFKLTTLLTPKDDRYYLSAVVNYRGDISSFVWNIEQKRLVYDEATPNKLSTEIFNHLLNCIKETQEYKALFLAGYPLIP
jgi:hypothetical protein